MGADRAPRLAGRCPQCRVAGWQGSWALGAAQQPAAPCAWQPRSAARSHGKPWRAEYGHSTESSSTPPVLVCICLPPCLLSAEVQNTSQNVGEQEKKRKERELQPACLYFIMHLCGNRGGNLGHHFVSGLKYFFFFLSINRKASGGEC